MRLDEILGKEVDLFFKVLMQCTFSEFLVTPHIGCIFVIDLHQRVKNQVFKMQNAFSLQASIWMGLSNETTHKKKRVRNTGFHILSGSLQEACI